MYFNHNVLIVIDHINSAVVTDFFFVLQSMGRNAFFGPHGTLGSSTLKVHWKKKSIHSHTESLLSSSYNTFMATFHKDLYIVQRCGSDAKL